MSASAVPEDQEAPMHQQKNGTLNDNSQVTLRPYQTRIIEQAFNANTIVVLPTGAGKTLIAAELILQIGTPAVFLVPTCLLVEQQQAALRSWTNLDVKPYSGGAALPSSFHILVSTPKAFQMAQMDVRNSHLRWDSLQTVVFDEVHHVLKEHPYRKLALSLHSSGARPRVLGLTASYTYAVGEEQAKISLQRMCDELRVTRLETAEEEELRESGYHAMGVNAEVLEATIKGAVPPEVLPVEKRKPHLMMHTFFSRVLNGDATPFASCLARCVLQMEIAMTEIDPAFTAPIQSSLSLKQWGVAAHRHASRHVNNVGFLFGQLEHWYEALRLLIVSWEEEEYAAVLFLRMLKCDSIGAISAWPLPVADSIRGFWSESPTQFRRLDNLRSVLIQKHKQLINFRGLLFVQQRVTTHILAHFIETDWKLKHLFKTAVLYASSSPATPSFSVSKTQAKTRMQSFASGKVNMLITTVVAEEGMNVPSANCVIRFDPMHHAVSLVQGRGRARQENSAFVVMTERDDRPTACLAAAEKQQLDLVRTFQPKPSGDVMAKVRVAQSSRESAAKQILTGPLDANNALFKLHSFCQKTKVSIESKHQHREEDYAVDMRYHSALRTVTVQGVGCSKKAATADAAVQMMISLRWQVLHQ